LPFDNILLCDVKNLTYDFEKKAGALEMAQGHNCDMKGCIELFEPIDKNVKQILTFSGRGIPDTGYTRAGKEWQVVSAKKKA
jgi:hypothetical protein